MQEFFQRHIKCQSMEEKTVETPRRPNWTEKEKMVLVEAVRQREEHLFGKMKGPGGVKNIKIKEEAWEEVAEAVNAISETVNRSTEEVRKQYANIKQRAKEKSDAIRRPSTGGGPKPPSPTPVEAELLNSMEDRPTLCGLSSGHDTEEVILGIVPSACDFNSTSSLATYNEENINDDGTLTLLNLSNVQPVAIPSSSSSKTSKRRKTMEDEEILTLRAERQKYIQEVKKLKEETEYYKVKTMYLKLKLSKMNKDAEQ